MLTLVEENYIKALLHLSSKDRAMTQKEGVGTNELASFLDVKPSTVNEMLKRLKEKKLVYHEKYKKITLTDHGEAIGLTIIRKHRLWETFLCTKLEFEWDEVHDVAEQLEHVQSKKLIEKIDKFLGYPKYDPHGDPIPDHKGILPRRETKKLSLLPQGSICTVLAVSDTSKEFLNYLETLKIQIGTEIMLEEKISYDNSMKVEIEGVLTVLSKKVSENILVG
ncbi:metal-dependent transcriptional regulator [Aquimarina addita]|uniref:Transcriptional regulator MntR n=1 Tax=Aquimarina addita TaxID=870485 RepID=A0ABP6UT17_9FLAO